jgi:hypothetical protein
MTSLKPNLFCLLVFIVSLLGKSSAEDLSFPDGELSAVETSTSLFQALPALLQTARGRDLPRQKL